ncbi:MAG: hypothetical protein HKO59_00615 [Phycisphaerales bacterium]|nr:glycogen-binding domain-containing protein [Phycisphaerae bacterium]NNM24482.1 hypothetical protein [Phycisphaerales bacterium]
MVDVDGAGRIIFTVEAPGAHAVELVGAFDGWHEQRFAMERRGESTWRLTLDPHPGTYLFRYRVDGRWVLDDAAHGVVTTPNGETKNRLYRPPVRLDPDAIAA